MATRAARGQAPPPRPADDRIEIEAVLENRDIGFVAVGQRVELKVDAFPFTCYGLLGGWVTSIDRDAEAAGAGQPVARQRQRAPRRRDRPRGGERLRYIVHIAVEPGGFDVDGRAATLPPRMSVKAEIITGGRRIVDFLLAPLREHLQDALRKR